MPKHGRENAQNQERGSGQNPGQLGEHATRASALIAARAQQKKAADAGVSGMGGDSTPPSRQDYPKNLADYIKRNVVYIVSAIAVIAIVAIGVIVLGAVMPDRSDLNDTAEEAPAYVSPYDWTKLDRADGRYRYIVDGDVKSRLGIDVSENQHEIDWQAVADDGIEFAMIRLGYRGATAGDLYLDEQYWNYMDGAAAAGLDRGVYFFSQANSVDEAVEEAEFVLDYLGGTPLEYPVAFDSEETVLNLDKSRTTGLSNDDMTAIAEAFCKRIEQDGYDTIVYGNSRDLSRYHYEDLENHSVWWAEYGTPVPAANIDITMWQYSNSGEVAGIPVSVDMNLDLTHALD